MILKWLGINGFEFNHNGRSILLDPYVSRNSKKVCDPDAVAKYIRKADYIFMGHSHWDHLADSAEIIRRTGASIAGSLTTCNICRAQGVPEEKFTLVSPGTTVKYGDFKVDFIESMHMQPASYQGCYETVPEKISTIEDFLEGGTMALRFHFGNLKILNIGSANFVESALKGTECDILLLGIALRAESFIKDLMKIISPKILIPTHFDHFETPMNDPGEWMSISDFKKEMHEIAPQIKIIVPETMKEIDSEKIF